MGFLWGLACARPMPALRGERRAWLGRVGVAHPQGRVGREAWLPPSTSRCFNSSGGENKDFRAVTDNSSGSFYCCNCCEHWAPVGAERFIKCM